MSEAWSADVIVVGSGAAGSVVARRLHDAGASVLVLEAGGSNQDPAIADPHAWSGLLGGSYDWAYRTEPQEQLGGRRIQWAQGRVVGGGSSINLMIWVRGCAADLDHWAYLGNTGWSYADMLPILRRIEDFDRGGSDVRGAGGPMPVWTDWEADPIHRSVVDAMQELGVPFNEDYNGREIIGTGYTQYNMRDGHRVSTADAYLLPVVGTPGVELLTNAVARRLIITDGRCTGVEFERGGRLECAYAGAEVVVASGVIGSPKLLMLSGVGPASDLGAHDIKVVADLPGVGRNLHDHVYVPLQFTTERPIQPSPPGIPALQTNSYFSTDPSRFSPDIQTGSFGLLMPLEGVEAAGEGQSGFTITVKIVRTASRGRVRLSGPDPAAAPLIDPGTYRAPGDLESMLAGIRFLRGLGRTDALADWGTKEILPGTNISDDDLESYARRMTSTAYHPVGTCKMGVDAWSVVDPQLRVRGLEGLRVADSSIMPAVTSGNTHVPSIAIGERAADLMIATKSASVPAGVAL